ncbi:MAG TPA: response regulator [Gammaproteobacteria bacterium]|nr:response regulator [Gammaproteobacteria bacterium]
MKTALVVDDSRVARAVLRKTLVGYGVAVDEVPSAEAAIEYLKVDRPDVIFLDHQMPGMDGFDALGALKTNPGTATIPVMMYTSQEGQFYVSQARALGAVDVLPKSLAPADVERVLRSHHLIGEPRRAPDVGNRPSLDDHHDLVMRFRSMLDEQAAMLMSDFRRELERAHSASAGWLRQTLDEFGPKPTSFHARLVSGVSLAALAAAVAVGILYVRDGLSTSQADEPPGLVAMETVAVSAAGVAIPEPTAATAPRSQDMIDAAARSWSFTQHYPHDATPLDDERARRYAPLLSELRNEGFTGTLTLGIHEGRYCINYAADGSSQLAPPDQPAATCDYIGPLQSGAGQPLQSPTFADMVASATRDGQLEVDTVLHGATEPIIDYPGLDYSVTAGYWNSIADINQRISMRVSGEGAADSGERFTHLVR